MRRTFIVTDYGADASGHRLSTPAIQSALDAAHEAGGGDVVLSPGRYLSGTLIVRSGVRLHLEAGAMLAASPDRRHYPRRRTRVAGVEMIWPLGLLTVIDADDAHIDGSGTIDGQGEPWWNAYWGTDHLGGMRARYTGLGLRWAVDYDCERPRNVLVFNSSRVSVSGLRIVRSPFWNVHVCYSDRVDLSDLTIEDNPGPSSDGIDIDSSTRVRVRDCRIAVNDDDICIKSGRDADGRRVGRPSSDIEVSDCAIGAGAGITLGSEISGGMHDISFHGIRMVGTDEGIRLKSAPGRAGVVERVTFSDVSMRDVGTCFSFNTDWNPSYSSCRVPEGMGTRVPEVWRALTEPESNPGIRNDPGLFRDLHLNGITADPAHPVGSAFTVKAPPETAPFTDFTFSDLDIPATSPGSIRGARSWSFDRCAIRTAGERPDAALNAETLTRMSMEEPAS